jgi:hypothetical protein
MEGLKPKINVAQNSENSMNSSHSESVKSCAGRGLPMGHVSSKGSYQVFKTRTVSGYNSQMEQAGGSH